MTEVTNEQWREAHRIINQCKKETAMKQVKQIKDFIKENDRTFWKQTSDYHTAYIHIHVSSEENKSHYATLFIFDIQSNGRNSIKQDYLDQNELYDFLEGASEDAINRKRELEDCECECECSCYEEEELPKVNITKISEKQFKKMVQVKVLDDWSIGLEFKQ